MYFVKRASIRIFSNKVGMRGLHSHLILARNLWNQLMLVRMESYSQLFLVPNGTLNQAHAFIKSSNNSYGYS